MPGKNPTPTRRLPQQPNLEQLRKQAKELLEQYRQGEPAAVAEGERFEWKPDSAAFAYAMRTACWRGPTGIRAGPS